MYYAIVVLLMLVFPVLSIAIDATFHPIQPLFFLFGKWFVFWAVGIRLFLAGSRQIMQPRYTAEKILGIKGDDALLVVRELGFANVAIGAVAVASMWMSVWTTPAALTGGIFYCLAGINHALHKHRNKLENVAMVSDLFTATILVTYFCWFLRQ